MVGAVTPEADRGHQEGEPDQGCTTKVDWPGPAQSWRNCAYQQQSDTKAQHAICGPVTPWIQNGQHSQPSFGVVVAINPGDCQEMGHLPKEQYREQEYCCQID